MAKPDGSAIDALDPPRLAALFAEDEDRVARFSVDVAGLHFDWSKTHLTHAAVQAFAALAKAQDLAGKREALFAGKPVNVTADRAAEHGAERGEGAQGRGRAQCRARGVDAASISGVVGYVQKQKKQD